MVLLRPSIRSHASDAATDEICCESCCDQGRASSASSRLEPATNIAIKNPLF